MHPIPRPLLSNPERSSLLNLWIALLAHCWLIFDRFRSSWWTWRRWSGSIGDRIAPSGCCWAVRVACCCAAMTDSRIGSSYWRQVEVKSLLAFFRFTNDLALISLLTGMHTDVQGASTRTEDRTGSAITCLAGRTRVPCLAAVPALWPGQHLFQCPGRLADDRRRRWQWSGQAQDRCGQPEWLCRCKSIFIQRFSAGSECPE